MYTAKTSYEPMSDQNPETGTQPEDPGSWASEDLPRLASTLTANGFKMTGEAGFGETTAQVARRADWLSLMHIHTFVVIFTIDRLEIEQAEALSDAARDYAIKHKGGMPRKLQTGTITLPTFVSRAPSDELRQWFKREHNHRQAAMEFPVLADIDAHRITMLEGSPKRGFFFETYLRGVVRDTLGPGLRCKVS